MTTNRVKAIGVTELGPVTNLKNVTVARPTLQPHDVLVRVKAVSINQMDFKVRKAPFFQGNEFSEEKPLVMGYDASGIIEEIGSEVKNFKKGDEVVYSGDVMRYGTNAQFHAVDRHIIEPKPKNLNWAEAAAYPLVFATAWEGIVESMHIPEDKAANANRSILITSGASGVGSISIQIAKQVLGLKVIATASRPESQEFAKKMGADHVIDHSKDLKEQLDKLGFQGGVD